MTAPPPDNFPFEIVETTGENALAKWEQLKAAGRGVPVVVGDIDAHPALGLCGGDWLCGGPR